MFEWTEKDEQSIEALKYLKENNQSLCVPPDGKGLSLTFDVVDYYKANNFIYSIGLFDDDPSKIERITGIHVTSVGYPYKNILDAIKLNLIHSLDLIEQGEKEIKCGAGTKI